MQTLKSALVMLLLAGVGYGAFLFMQRHNAPPPAGVDTEIPDIHSITLGHDMGVPAAPGEIPTQQLPSGQAQSGPVQSGPAGAPSFAPPSPDGSLPVIPPAPPLLGPSAAGANNTVSQTPPINQPMENALPSAPVATVPPLVNPPTAGPPTDSTVTNPTAPPPANVVVPPGPGAAPSATAEKPHAAAADAPRVKFGEIWPQVEKLLAEDKLVEAHLELTQLYGQPDLSPQEDEQVTEMLGKLAGSIIYDATSEHNIWPAYTVQPGDSLEKIASHNGVTPALLMKINGLTDPRAIKPGDGLKVVKGPFNAIVNLPRSEITLVLADRYAGRVPIHLGREFTPPDVRDPLSIVDKDPGDLWIGLGGKLGIHKQNSVTKSGAVRDSIAVAAEDAQDLYDILSMGSKVQVWR